MDSTKKNLILNFLWSKYRGLASYGKVGKRTSFVITASLKDRVTTTDELIPSGETSSYRSNPLKLAEFTLSRKDQVMYKGQKVVKNKKSTWNWLKRF